MAREPLLILDCSSYSKDLVDIIKLLNNIGWVFKEEKMEYLPLDDGDMYNWQEEALSFDKLFDIISQKQQNNENVGVILYHNKSDKGTTFLAKSTDEIMLGLDINRKTIDCDITKPSWGGDYTDISWYVINVIRELEKSGCLVGQFRYEEYIG